MKTFWPLMTPTEIEEARARQAPVFLPIGTIEVNGPQLPLGYDYLVAGELARAASERLEGLWLPPITFGVSEALSSFAGTVWIRPSTLGDQVREILQAVLGHGFKRIILLNNHIPNQYPVEYALRELRRQTQVVIPSIFPAQLARDLGKDLFTDPSESGHGGEPSTSLMLALFPEDVRMDLVQPRKMAAFRGMDVTSPLETNFLNSRVNLYLDISDLTDTGGWGDPKAASADRGRQLFERMVDFVCQFTKEFPFGEPGQA